MNKNDSVLPALFYSISLLVLIFEFIISVKENLSLLLPVINAFVFVALCILLAVGVKKKKEYLIHTLPILLIFCTITLSGNILYGSKQYSTDAQSYYEISAEFELMPNA